MRQYHVPTQFSFLGWPQSGVCGKRLPRIGKTLAKHRPARSVLDVDCPVCLRIFTDCLEFSRRQ
jgi:hypothetical protein